MPLSTDLIRGTTSTRVPQHPYPFETISTCRTDPEKNLELLYQRIQIDQKGIGAPLLELFHKFGLDVLENIVWYENRIAKLDASMSKFERRASSFGAGALLLVLALGVATFAGEKAPPALGLLGGQVAFLVGGLLTVAQNVAAMRDQRGRLSVFWKASADLKQVLYAFEERWRGRTLDKAELAADLRTQLERARQIAEEERRGYFQTYRAPSEVYGSIASAVSGLRSSAAEIGRQQASLEKTSAVDLLAANLTRRLTEAQTLLVEAKADLASKEAQGTGAKDEAADAAIEKARVEERRLETLVQHLRAALP